MTCDEGRPCQRWYAVLAVSHCGLHNGPSEGNPNLLHRMPLLNQY